ncbi:MAG: cell envelope integrity EipB family protein [Roseibium sp.]
MRSALTARNLVFGAIFLSVGFGGAVTPGLAVQASAQSTKTVLAAHRAVYDMKLGDTEGQSGVAGLKGRMVYDFSGNACDGYSVNFRFVTQFRDANGGSQVTDLQTTSFEEPGALGYQFLSKTYVDDKLVESSRGTASLGADNKTVELKEPTEKSLDIGLDVQFPTEHLLTILESARSGDSFIATDIFDGAETGDKVYATTTVIGAKSIVEDVTGKPNQALAGHTYWPVTVAYFDPAAEKESGEQMPVYQLSFRLLENGISDRLVLDYGDFTLMGTLSDLELYKPDTCTD